MIDGANVLRLEKPGYPEITIETHVVSNGLTVVLCMTLIKDHKGLPHTLEHLIFCGSEDHPERGYLDRLATLCQSNGTNAYTSDDHTCYTFSSSSFNGLTRMLPVFLDHIFRPTLDENVIKREVFHKDTSGHGRGVVYCEMQGRNWSEGDLLDLHMRRRVFSAINDPQYETYFYECGGRTGDIAHLTGDEIRKYHQMFYRPENAVIVLCGAPEVMSANRECLLSIAEGVTFNYMEKMCIEKPLSIPTDQPEVILFPAADESLGSVGLVWRGPKLNDLYTISALHVLMRILKDTSASPLAQHFVERPDPIATDIDYDVKPFHHTIIQLVFSGVPNKPVAYVSIADNDGMDSDVEDSFETEKEYLNPGVLKAEVTELIFKYIFEDTDVVESRINVAIDSLQIKLQEHLEDDPHEVISSYLMPEIVDCKWPWIAVSSPREPIGTAITNMPQHLDQLRNEPLEFWTSLMKRFLFDQPPMEVIMKPSKALIEEIKARGIAELEGIEACDVPEGDGYSVDVHVEPFPIDLPAPISCQTISTTDYPGQVVITPPSTVRRLTLSIDLRGVPEHLLKYLVLFQELLFQSDLSFEDEAPPKLLASFEGSVCEYQALVRILAPLFHTSEAALGFDNSLFSVGYFDSHFNLFLHGPAKFTRAEVIELAETVLKCSVFSYERVSEVLESILNQLKETWRDPSNILDCRLLELLAQAHGLQLEGMENMENGRESPLKKAKTVLPPFIELAVRLTTQQTFLKELYNIIDVEGDTIIEALEELRSALLSAPRIINYGIGAGHDSEAIPDMESIADTASPAQPLNLYQLPKYGSLEGRQLNADGLLEVIPVGDITSSYLSIVLPLQILPRSGTDFRVESFSDDEVRRFFIIILISQCLSFTEGPLYRQIRGAGLAYHASISVALWSGLLSLDIGDSANPAVALAVARKLLAVLMLEAECILANDTSRPCQFLTEELLRTGQAVQIYQFVNERSTSGGLNSLSLRNALRGLPFPGSAEEIRWNEILLSLTLKDLAHGILEIFPSLLDPKRTLSLVCVPSAKAAEISKSLTDAHVPHTMLSSYVPSE